MSTPIRLPSITAGFESGKIASWHKAVGEAVEKGDILFDVETDKAVVEVHAEESGVLGAIEIPAGSDDVPVDAVMGFLLKRGETQAEPGKAERVLASPLARRTAEQQDVDLSGLKGRGPNGRILKADVDAVAAKNPELPAKPAPPAPSAAPSPARTSSTGVDIPHSRIRKVIAQRLTSAKQDIPHFYLTLDCEIDALLEVRRQLNEHLAGAGTRISVNDCIVKAVAQALVDVPDANVRWSDEAIHQHGTVDISVAVATAAGLMTPIVRDADTRSLADLSKELKRLVTRAVAGKLQPDEFNGGGFSVSNLGMYGIRQFSAIINPPQSCILAVGAGEKRPVVRGDTLAVATVMTCTLSVDHRSIDGAVGARFLTAFRKYVESPALLLL